MLINLHQGLKANPCYNTPGWPCYIEAEEQCVDGCIELEEQCESAELSYGWCAGSCWQEYDLYCESGYLKSVWFGDCRWYCPYK